MKVVTQEQIDKVVEQYINLLPIDNGMQNNSDVKASKFLLAIAKLAEFRLHLTQERIKKDSLKSIAYAEAINNAPGTSAPIREANAEANADYISVQSEVASTDNLLKYVVTMQDLFTNAHLLYRALLKEQL